MKNTSDHAFLSVIANGKEKNLIFVEIKKNRRKTIVEAKETTLKILKKLLNYKNTNYKIKEKYNFNYDANKDDYVVSSAGSGIVVLQNTANMMISSAASRT